MSWPAKRTNERLFYRHPQTRGMICKVYDFMKSEALVKHAENITDARSRTAKAVGISARTVTKVLRERKIFSEDLPGSSPDDDDEPSTSALKKKKFSKIKVCMDEYDIGIVRKTIHEYHRQTLCPTMENINCMMARRVGFKYCDVTLEKYLNKLGFRFQKTAHDRRALMEDYKIQLARLRYLNQVQAHRKAGKHIVYTGETCIHTNDVEKDCVSGPILKLDKGERIIIMHAGSSSIIGGFVPDAAMTCRVETTGSNFRDSLTELHYITWLELKLIPNLPRNAVVIIDDAPYRNVEVNKAPLSYSSKEDLKAWLTSNNIPFTGDDTNVELFELVRKNQKAYRRYNADEMLERHGFTVIRQPPLHPELNALESIWQLVKTYVTFRNVEQTYESVIDLIAESFAENDSDVWSRVCKGVEDIENEYLKYGALDFSFMKAGNKVANPEYLVSEGDSDSD